MRRVLSSEDTMKEIKTERHGAKVYSSSDTPDCVVKINESSNHQLGRKDGLLKFLLSYLGV